MRALRDIRDDFESFDSLEEPQRTDSLVILMDELEHDHGAFKINPTDDDLQNESVKLYREISCARDFGEE